MLLLDYTETDHREKFHEVSVNKICANLWQ